MTPTSLPRIIQGGMGAGVSSWRLARAVSQAGQLGVVSGTGLDVILARRLQLGDPDGHIRRALDHFPFPHMAERIVRRYFIPGGKSLTDTFRPVPYPSDKPTPQASELLVAANFVEVYLAKEGHSQPVGINYLEKIQLPTLPSLFGAMLAGVDWVLMGAGIPRTIPGHLDRLAAGQAAKLKLDVRDASRSDEFFTEFDPRRFCGGTPPELKRPRFVAIVSSATLGAMLVKKSNGRVDGLVVEESSAGGHNAPPRGRVQLNERGELVYGHRDVPDLEAIRAIGVPFWLAGSYASPQRLAYALEAGAAGVQVGTVFAYCDESDLRSDLKHAVLEEVAAGTIDVLTDPLASPTGFPFKVVNLEGTLADAWVYRERCRICDLAYLRQAYKLPDGSLGWRCPAEPVKDFQRKGGDPEETQDRKCVCNALMSNIGLGQIRRGGEVELPLITSGTDFDAVATFLHTMMGPYTAKDVIEYLLSAVPAPIPAVG